MRIKKTVAGLLLCLVLLNASCTRFANGLRSHVPPAGSFEVASRDLRFVDRSRETQANGDFAGAPSRTLEVTICSPCQVSNGASPSMEIGSV